MKRDVDIDSKTKIQVEIDIQTDERIGKKKKKQKMRKKAASFTFQLQPLGQWTVGTLSPRQTVARDATLPDSQPMDWQITLMAAIFKCR